MGQSKSKSNIKYAKLNCPSNPEVDSEDEIGFDNESEQDIFWQWWHSGAKELCEKVDI